jgi:CHAD domain-containing protein
MRVAAPAGVAFGRDQHMLAEGRKRMTTNRTAIRRRLAIRGRAHRPPWGARKAGHGSIVAPLGATFAATVALGVGVVMARSERERRRQSQHRRERHLGLAPGERTGDGLKRMALGQIDLALEALADGDGTAPSERGVHEARKALKRLRALLALLRHELGERAYARESATLRDIARRLSEARDAAVMLATLDALIARHPRRLGRRNGVRELRRRLATEHERQRQQTLSDAASRAEVLGELHAFRWRVAAWSLPDGQGLELVGDDLARLYRQGRKRYRRAARDRGERMITMHQWRKRVKDLRYAIEMLDRRGSEQRLRKLSRRADDLGEMLGEDHDLAVFAERLRAGAHRRGRDQTWKCGRGTRKVLLRAIAARRRVLRKRALRQGRQLFRAKPKRLTRRVRTAHAKGARGL